MLDLGQNGRLGLQYTEEEEEIFFITITTISIIGKGDSGDPPSRCLVKGRERVADPVAESTLTGTVQ